MGYEYTIVHIPVVDIGLMVGAVSVCAEAGGIEAADTVLSVAGFRVAGPSVIFGLMVTLFAASNSSSTSTAGAE